MRRSISSWRTRRKRSRFLAVRFYQVFFSVTAAQSRSWSDGPYGDWRPSLKAVGVVYMTLFRLLLLASLYHALITLMRGRGPLKRAAACFLGLNDLDT